MAVAFGVLHTVIFPVFNRTGPESLWSYTLQQWLLLRVSVQELLNYSLTIAIAVYGSTDLGSYLDELSNLCTPPNFYTMSFIGHTV